MSGRPCGPKDTNTKKRKLRKVEFVFVSFEPQGLPDMVYVRGGEPYIAATIYNILLPEANIAIYIV